MSPLPAVWRGSAYAAHLAIRSQIIVIYASTAVSKIMDPTWRQGNAIYVIFYHPDFGLPPSVRGCLESVLSSFWLLAVTSWAVIAVQLAIAVMFLFRSRARRLAVVLGIGMHMGIALLMGLPSFSLVMIGLLVVGSAADNKAVHITCAPP